MKYVVMKDDETDEIMKIGRFSGKPDYLDEYYSPLSNTWKADNTLYSNLFDGLLEEISEAEANRLITAHFSREKQAA